LVRGAVERATAGDIEELRSLATAFERAVNEKKNEEARAANYRFHRRIHSIPNMPLTLHFVQILWARYPFDLINKVGGRVERAVEEHAQLLKAFVESDVAAAVLATRRHIETGWLELEQAMQSAPIQEKPDGEPFAVKTLQFAEN
jgi:DNA-binding GntR family transcriptional regulator